MTKLTGPFLVERAHQPEINTRRSLRYVSRRRPRTVETSDPRPQHVLLSQVSEFDYSALKSAWEPEPSGADGLAREPQLPDKKIRQPWWSRPSAKEPSLPEIALRLKEQEKNREQIQCGAPSTHRGRPKSSGNLPMQCGAPLTHRGRPKSSEFTFKTSQSSENLYGNFKSTGSGEGAALAPPEVVELALELNKHRTPSASSPSSRALSLKRSSEAESMSLAARLKQLPKLKSSSAPVWDHGHDNISALALLTGWVTRCAKCNLNLGDEKMKFCRGCGEPRLENKLVGEVFFTYIGNKRTIIRKTDLTKFIQHIRYLHHKDDSLTRQALHRVTCEVHRSFDQVLAFQLGEGNCHSHGLTMEYFPFFLGKIAVSRSIAVKDLITFLLEELHGQKHKEMLEDFSVTSPEVPSHMSAVRALADQCPQCGLYADGNQFCRKCGYKLKAPDSEITSASEPLGLASVFQKKGRKTLLDGVDTEAMMHLASQYNMSFDDVRRRKDEFQTYDRNDSGTLTYSEFLEAVRARANIPAPTPIPEHLVNSSWSKNAIHRDKDGQYMAFEEFLTWSCNTEYSEELLVTDTEERRLRQLARENGLCLPEVERIKNVFDKFDRDKSGFIDEDEFRQVLLVLMRVKNPNDLPQTKVRRCWREVDTDMSGSIAFEEFLIWYFNFFEDH